MLGAMATLAALCALLGVAPAWVAPALERGAAAWVGGGQPIAGPPLAVLVPFGWVSATAVALLGIGGLLVLGLRPKWRRGRERQPELPTWDCGYAAASARLQTTGSSFAEIITSRFAWALWPRERRPAIEGVFPASAAYQSHVDDVVLDRLLRPAGEVSHLATAWFRSLPRGQLQRYILYVLCALVPLMLWALFGGGSK
jgi:hypothetical protein